MLNKSKGHAKMSKEYKSTIKQQVMIKTIKKFGE